MTLSLRAGAGVDVISTCTVAGTSTVCLTSTVSLTGGAVTTTVSGVGVAHALRPSISAAMKLNTPKRDFRLNMDTPPRLGRTRFTMGAENVRLLNGWASPPAHKGFLPRIARIYTNVRGKSFVKIRVMRG